MYTLMPCPLLPPSESGVHPPLLILCGSGHIPAAQQLTPCPLQIACLEAQDAGVPSAAKQALLMLLDMLAAGSDNYQQSDGYEATVFTNLIKLILEGARDAVSINGC